MQLFTERRPEEIGERLSSLLLATTGNFEAQIAFGELDGWLLYLKDDKGPYVYKDFTEMDVL